MATYPGRDDITEVNDVKVARKSHVLEDWLKTISSLHYQ